LVLPFWYQLTQVVLEKRPLNGCSVVVVQLPLTTLGQETRWAYSTMPPSPHGCIVAVAVLKMKSIMVANVEALDE